MRAELVLDTDFRIDCAAWTEVSARALDRKVMDTLQNMRVFVRVVEAGSFTGAAQHLNTTTAYASRAVSDMLEAATADGAVSTVVAKTSAANTLHFSTPCSR